MATEHVGIAIDDSGLELDSELLLRFYYDMLRARRTDERAWALHRQGKVPFHISAIGQEAIQVAAAHAIRVGYDYVLPYYRDLALNLTMGYTPAEFMLALFGKAGETTSGARQMPSHWGSRRLNIVSHSSPVATQVPQAAGMALASKLRGEDRITLTALGEGSTSQGEWYEGMNWAGVHRLPMICLVENNEYAISVPTHMQFATPNIADRAAGFGVVGVIVDGNDVLASFRAMREAVELARSGGGATLLEAKTYRITPHSSDDDDRTYRDRAEVEEWKGRDPLARFGAYLTTKGLLTERQIGAWEAQIRAEVDAAQHTAEAAPYPDPEDAFTKVFAPREG